MSVSKAISLFLAVCALFTFGSSASAKDEWTDEALSLASDIQDSVFVVDETDWDEYEQELESLAPEVRIYRSQELAFSYLKAFLFPRYYNLKARYEPLLQSQGSHDQKVRQELLDTFSVIGQSNDYVAVAKNIRTVIKGEDLSSETILWGHLAAALTEINYGSAPIALRDLQAARLLAPKTALSQYMQREIHGTSAYVLMQAGDFQGAISSYKRRYNIAPPNGFPIDSASSISSMASMLENAGYYEKASTLNGILMSRLHDGVFPLHRLFVTMGCGNLHSKLGNFDTALACFEKAEMYFDANSQNWMLWKVSVVNTLARAQRFDEARTAILELQSDPRFQESAEAQDKIALAQAILDINKGNTPKAIKELVNFFDKQQIKSLDERREMSREYQALINSETQNLEQNAKLKDDLLMRQTLLTGMAVCVCLALGIFLSILSRRRRKERILSITDPLTGLNNRRGFDEELCSLHLSAAKHNMKIAIGIVDLDRFKAVNDIYGHAVGDAVLVLVAKRLRECLGSEALLGRLGGDEFAFVLTDVTSLDDLRTTGQDICEALAQEERFGETVICPYASVGVAVCDASEITVADLYDRADFALYSNKENNNEVLNIFDDAHSAEFLRRKALEAALANAKPDEFDINYQPIVEMQTGKTLGFEALARWNSPTIGEVGPGEFIALAERMARITPLTRHFLVNALETAKTWPDHLNLSFNLSSHDLATLDLAAELKAIVLNSGFPPERIVMEVTETAMVTDTSLVREALQLLIETGVRIALDDFGTGYSSLLHLHEFTFDRIKVDRSLTKDLDLSAKKRSIVSLLINLSKNLGVDCVVEGVENERQVALLLAMQADLAQGFLFGEPLSKEEVYKRIADEQKAIQDDKLAINAR